MTVPAVGQCLGQNLQDFLASFHGTDPLLATGNDRMNWHDREEKGPYRWLKAVQKRPDPTRIAAFDKLTGWLA